MRLAALHGGRKNTTIVRLHPLLKTLGSRWHAEATWLDLNNVTCALLHKLLELLATRQEAILVALHAHRVRTGLTVLFLLILFGSID